MIPATKYKNTDHEFSLYSNSENHICIFNHQHPIDDFYYKLHPMNGDYDIYCFLSHIIRLEKSSPVHFPLKLMIKATYIFKCMKTLILKR